MRLVFSILHAIPERLTVRDVTTAVVEGDGFKWFQLLQYKMKTAPSTREGEGVKLRSLYKNTHEWALHRGHDVYRGAPKI